MHYPDFIEDKSYIEMDSSVPEMDQLRAMLNNLTRIHLLTANKFNSFNEMIREYLISGIEVFGLETGIVSEIKVGETYKVCDVVSPLEALEIGQEFPLEDTYCREVVKSLQVIGFPEVGKLDYMNCHPVYQNLKLEAYLSAPIFVDDKLFGTLNFTSTKPRMRGFSHHEQDLIQLMANSIGAFILLRDKEEKLVALNQRIKQFVGYVAHDLRNPIGAILGFTKLANKRVLDDERLTSALGNITNSAETALEMVNTLLENAALSTGKIQLKREAIEFTTVLTLAIDSVTHFAKSKGIQISINATGTMLLNIDTKRIQQSLMNLLINAIKYSPNGSNITITANICDHYCHTIISNPIAQPTSTSTDSNTTDNKTYGSVGYGLDIVSEIMRAHKASFTTSIEDNRYNAELELPLIQAESKTEYPG
jgi:signal transduction histidine kinase